MPTTTRSASIVPPFSKRTVFFVDGSDFVFEVKGNAMFLMEGADKVTHIRAEIALHRPLIRRYDVNLQVPRAERGSDLEPDKACPDDNYSPWRASMSLKGQKPTSGPSRLP
jgi:hypothetical protein